MSIVNAQTNPYGPATLNLQIEQGADFLLPLHLQTGSSPVDWNLTGATFDAHFSLVWAPGQAPIPFVITPVNLVTGYINIGLAAATLAALVLPFPPRKGQDPQPVMLGGWLLNIRQSGFTKQIFNGTVQLAKDPAVT